MRSIAIENHIAADFEPGSVAMPKLVQPVIVSECRIVDGLLLPYPRDGLVYEGRDCWFHYRLWKAIRSQCHCGSQMLPISAYTFSSISQTARTKGNIWRRNSAPYLYPAESKERVERARMISRWRRQDVRSHSMILLSMMTMLSRQEVDLTLAYYGIKITHNTWIYT
jgi:hypothetical protein